MAQSMAPSLAAWLLEMAETQSKLGELHSQFCGRLRADGLPIWRSSLALEVLHPEISGDQYIWTDGNASVRDAHRLGVAQAPSYLNSPIRVVDETGQTFRARLDQTTPDMPLLHELKAQGATDYAAIPLPFLDQMRTAAITFATQKPDGFSESDLQDLHATARLFSPYAERLILRRMAIDLLDTYVGPRSGQRVFEGQIERGQIESIKAAIWFADLRGFTRMSITDPVESVLGALNDWLEVMAEAIEAQDGEVLKFMGDGVLAIFPLADSGPRGACNRALQAAREFCRGADALNATRAGAGAAPLEFGLGLHIGQIAYGNIGGKRRLDFTVIGSAVNYTSRLQELTKTAGLRVLVSEPVNALSGENLRSLGKFPLRGIDGEQEVFAI